MQAQKNPKSLSYKIAIVDFFDRGSKNPKSQSYKIAIVDFFANSQKNPEILNSDFGFFCRNFSTSLLKNPQSLCGYKAFSPIRAHKVLSILKSFFVLVVSVVSVL